VVVGALVWLVTSQTDLRVFDDHKSILLTSSVGIHHCEEKFSRNLLMNPVQTGETAISWATTKRESRFVIVMCGWFFFPRANASQLGVSLW
jgi:hypothetical protein